MRKQKTEAILYVRIPISLERKLVAACREQGRSKKEVVLRALLFALAPVVTLEAARDAGAV